MNIFLLILVMLLASTLIFLFFYFRKGAIKTYSTEASFQDVEKVLVETIAAEGWKLLSMHDIQARLVNAGFDIKRVAVYEICRPDYAASVLSDDRSKKFSSLMPCRISLYELQDGGTGLSMINAGMLSAIFGGVVKRVMSHAAAESDIIIVKTLKQIKP